MKTAPPLAVSFAFALALAFAASLAPGRSHAALPPLIPRAVLFGQPADESPELSPDGTHLAWCRRGENGIADVWVRDLATDSTRQITHVARSVGHAGWSPDGRWLLFLADRNGDENLHLWSVEFASGQERDLTPFADVRVEGVMADRRHPAELLVGMNLRDRRAFDLYRISLESGAVTFDTKNPGDVIAWTTDENFRVRGATALRAADAATVLRVRNDESAPWREIAVWPFAEAGFDRYQRIIRFVDGGRALLVQSSIGHDTSALVELDAASGRERRVLAHDMRCDLWNQLDAQTLMEPMLLFSGTGDTLLAAGVEWQKPEWKVMSPSVAEDFRLLSQLAGGGVFTVESRDSADRRWIVRLASDVDPGHFVLWDRSSRTEAPVFAAPAPNSNVLVDFFSPAAGLSCV